LFRWLEEQLLSINIVNYGVCVSLLSLVPSILLAWDLDAQKCFFKWTMKSTQAMAYKVVTLVANKANPQLLSH
jgi:hypothetical protein